MKTLSRRHVLATVPAVALAPGALALAACGAQARSTDNAKPVALRPDVTVQALVEIPAADQPLLDRVVARFKESVPQAPKVELGIGTAADHAPKAQALLAAGTAPDIIQLEAGTASSFIGKGFMAPLDAMIKRDKYDLSDYFDRSYPQFAWKGKQYGISKGMSNQSLYYNQTLFFF